jgi:hypothetical protein
MPLVFILRIEKEREKTLMAWNNDYVDVAERMRQFANKYPTGSIQTVSIDFKQVGEQMLVIYTAAAYRSPDDERPGIAMASEPFPGKTNFTRDSEVMNAETSAWGRCILAADPSITAKKIASANEVQNRKTPWEAPKGPAPKKGHDF